jgi:hypothetical protein
MALEHRNPSKFGRMAFPHAERGTRVLNDLTAPQAQAMFDYILIVSPLAEPDIRPCLNDALAFCLEATEPAVPGAASGEPAANPDARPYPSIEASRETSRGRAFVVRLSATETRVIEAGSEEEALKAARKP